MTKKPPAKAGRKAGALVAPAKDLRPAPTASEQRAIDAAVSRLTGALTDPPRFAARIGDGGALSFGSPHSDDVGWSAVLADSLGLSGSVITDVVVVGLLNMTGASTPKTDEEAEATTRVIREGVAFVQALAPTDAQQALLCVQMWASHCAMMKLSRLMHRADLLPQLATYGGLLNKAQRTYAAQVETLQKIRTGGKQQVEVRYVYVDARTQNVINGGGGGGQPAIGHQPHATGVPLWSADACGSALPFASGPGSEALPDARWQESRGTERG